MVVDCVISKIESPCVVENYFLAKGFLCYNNKIIINLMNNKNDSLLQLNLLSSCRRYNLPLRQCPQFLFFLMGFVIIFLLGATYAIATLRIGDPKIVSLLVLSVGAILFVIDYVVINSFERVAEASRMKTEFIGVVSHQLRSPLTNLRFALELLMSGKIAKVQENELEYFRILRENTQRMGDLINDLIVVSRIESGEFPLRKEKIDFGEMVQKVAEKSRAFADASNVVLELNIEPNIPPILADTLWLEQVIKNLLDNGIRYTKGKGTVILKAQNQKNKVYFEIKDKGVGIPKEEQKFIFRKFFRSKNAVRHQTEGSGLGLHIARNIIEMMDGKIWFESEEDKGTTFHFTLPVKS